MVTMRPDNLPSKLSNGGDDSCFLDVRENVLPYFRRLTPEDSLERPEQHRHKRKYPPAFTREDWKKNFLRGVDTWSIENTGFVDTAAEALSNAPSRSPYDQSPLPPVDDVGEYPEREAYTQADAQAHAPHLSATEAALQAERENIASSLDKNTPRLW